MILTITFRRKIYNQYVDNQATFGDILHDFMKEHMRILKMRSNRLGMYNFNYQGGRLKHNWKVADIIISDYSRLTIENRTKSETSILIHCDIPRNRTIELHEKIEQLTVAQLRQLMSDRTGIPVCLLYVLKDNTTVLSDSLSLVDYSVTHQSVIEMKVIAEWKYFVTMLILKSRSWLENNLSDNPVLYSFQLKVALHIGTWDNNMELVIFCLDLKALPCESISNIPEREWCLSDSLVDNWVTPAHLAAKYGNLRVLKLFVRNNVSCLLSKNQSGRSVYSEAFLAKNYACSEFIMRKIINNLAINRTHAMRWIVAKKILKWFCKAKVNLSSQRGVVRLISCLANSMDIPIRTGIRVDGLNYPTSETLHKSTSQFRLKKEKTVDYFSADSFPNLQAIGARNHLEITNTYEKLSYLGQVREAINIMKKNNNFT